MAGVQITNCLDVGKNYITTLSSALKQLNKMYEVCLTEIQAIISREPDMTLVLDNYNKVIQTRVQRGEISHRVPFNCIVNHASQNDTTTSQFNHPISHRYSPSSDLGPSRKPIVSLLSLDRLDDKHDSPID